ncbi:MAG: 2-C-methyl-D-erythritol 4-phosphate cytidylyltransferase [Oscillospiraceae bacterium]|nr:2-C-methyl-D-erythritol 4-phosphate cytidylyltransferase [Candidatus Equicaccousia limihippi]
MIYSAILAGGTGSRMKSTTPKQFLEIGGKPILVHTVDRFLQSEVDRIFIGVHRDWIDYAQNLINKYFDGAKKPIYIVEGGFDRLSTVTNIMEAIEKANDICEGDIIATHDSVRPFVTVDMINLSIQKAREVGACNTVTAATDTVVVSKDGQNVYEMPDRKEIYLGQCPQTFDFLKLKELIGDLSEDERATLTDVCKLFVLKNKPVALISGDASNFKITTMGDYDIAAAMAEKYLG